MPSLKRHSKLRVDLARMTTHDRTKSTQSCVQTICVRRVQIALASINSFSFRGACVRSLEWHFHVVLRRTTGDIWATFVRRLHAGRRTNPTTDDRFYAEKYVTKVVAACASEITLYFFLLLSVLFIVLRANGKHSPHHRKSGKYIINARRRNARNEIER